MKERIKKRILSADGIDMVNMLGVKDVNLRFLEERFPGAITVRGGDITLTGDDEKIDRLAAIFENLISLARDGRKLSREDVEDIINGGKKVSARINQLEKSVVFYSPRKRKGIVPRSIKQKKYIEAIENFDVVFAIGPAGTGKTFLAIASALAALKRGDIGKIFVSRPVVETGESLGFLPGDLQEKIDPYLRPIFDSFSYMIGKKKMQHMIENDIIEIAPLAYMRGRTLNNAFVILDEAQNSTVMQMKMFLTRLGVNSKAIVNGDITQIDLSDYSSSGLVTVKSVLERVEGVKFIFFTEEDVVRHSLVRRIIRAFSTFGQSSEQSGGKVNPAGSPEKRFENNSTAAETGAEDG
ncbi:MAG TPA: PhoH family protein [Candidatus Krumholzibacteriaceae bacterium]|nr:PhoH family protein [Candidatus Krumholzibacteriaceae bacterium]